MKHSYFFIFFYAYLLNIFNIAVINSMVYFPPDDIGSFIPIKESCGAAVNEKGFETYQSINSAFTCMLSGYKKVYSGLQDEIEYLNAESKKALKDGAIKKIMLPQGGILEPNQEIIFYTPEGECEAYLLAELYKEKMQLLSPWQKKLEYIFAMIFLSLMGLLHDGELDILKSFISTAKLYENDVHEIMQRIDKIQHSHNHYLSGHLLGYDKNDIKYFYLKNNLENIFENDKKKSEEWLHEHQC